MRKGVRCLARDRVRQLPGGVREVAIQTIGTRGRPCSQRPHRSRSRHGGRRAHAGLIQEARTDALRLVYMAPRVPDLVPVQIAGRLRLVKPDHRRLHARAASEKTGGGGEQRAGLRRPAALTQILSQRQMVLDPQPPRAGRVPVVEVGVQEACTVLDGTGSRERGRQQDARDQHSATPRRPLELGHRVRQR